MSDLLDFDSRRTFTARQLPDSEIIPCRHASGDKIIDERKSPLSTFKVILVRDGRM